MNRRALLKRCGVLMAGAGVAGCTGGSDGTDDPDDAGPGGTATATDTPEVTATPTQTTTPSDPASQLDVRGFATAARNSTMLQADLQVENPTDRAITGEFAAEMILDEDRGALGGEPVERTVPGGETDQFRLDIADTNEIRFDQITGYVFEGFQLVVTVNGTPQPSICPDVELTVPNEDGCNYPHGAVRSHVKVEYAGNWEGTMTVDGRTRSVSRDEATFGAPEGFSTSYLQVGRNASQVSVALRKGNEGDGELAVRIVELGAVVAEGTTTSAGTPVELSAEL